MQSLAPFSIVLLAVTATFTGPAAAESGDEKRVAFTTNMLTPLFGAYYLDASLRLSSRFVLLFNTSYLTLSSGDWKTKTGTVGGGVLYHWQGTAMRRWYLEASSELLLSSWRYEPSGDTASIQPGFSLASVIGYRFIWDIGFVLDLAAGVVVLHFPSVDIDAASGPAASHALTRFFPAAKLNVGWAF